jgi:hypothetical protein
MMTAKTKREERDDVLAQHAENRERLISIADAVALEIATRDGEVCMPRVLAEMRRRGHGWLLESVDPRWSGAVLLPSRGWERTGAIVREGSRARPVPLWRIKVP